MPQFSHLDRCMIEAEQSLWVAHEAMAMIEHSGAFAGRINAVRMEVEKIAKEMREYNDQFESTDE